MWRIFSKKNRTYTIGAVVAFVIIVYVVYRYVLSGTFVGDWFRRAMGNPSSIILTEKQSRTQGTMPGYEGGGTSLSPFVLSGEVQTPEAKGTN